MENTTENNNEEQQANITNPLRKRNKNKKSKSQIVTPTLTDLINITTQLTLDSLDDDTLRNTSIKTLEAGLVKAINDAIVTRNILVDSKNKENDLKSWPMINTTPVSVIHALLMVKYKIVMLNMNPESIDVSRSGRLAMYVEPDEDSSALSGPNRHGLYTTDLKIIDRVIGSMVSDGLKKAKEEIYMRMEDWAPIVTVCDDRDLIAVNNGIFNYQTKELERFSSDKVFVTKSQVDYNPGAKNTVITHPDDGYQWDVESWLSDLSDDPEVVEVLWEILGAIIRPNVKWNKSAWLYSEQGNNGKGTLCELMRALCGPGSYIKLSIDDFSKDFALTGLQTASAIITDENDVGAYIDKAANLKAVITGDVIQINEKHKNPIAVKPKCFMVQCLNGLPQIKDKSESLYRRQLFIPMTKCFTGVERKYIKDDYLHRKEVLEYVLHKVLHSDYYTLSNPDACSLLLDHYKIANDPVRQFIDDFQDTFIWNIVPFNFAHALYLNWCKRENPGTTPMSARRFSEQLKNTLLSPSNNTCWTMEPTGRKQYSVFGVTDTLMHLPEPLITQYDLEKDFGNNDYKGNEVSKKCIYAKRPARVRGIIRKDMRSEDQAKYILKESAII